MRALAIAATGMASQQTNVEVIANNIANVNTTGFKRGRAEFTDLLYQIERASNAPARTGEGNLAEGLSIGLGSRAAAVRSLHQQGALTRTGNRFDVALNGRGYLQIAGLNGETFYTRSGSFNKNAEGQLVNVDGLLLQPAISIPIDASEVVINETGQVLVRIANQPDLQNVGQITLANFANEAGLEAMGGNLFRETSASGSPQVGMPGDPSFAVVYQGYLEGSNVDPVKEITELIAAQRAYEMNSKVIQAADEMYATIARGGR